MPWTLYLLQKFLIIANFVFNKSNSIFISYLQFSLFQPSSLPVPAFMPALVPSLLIQPYIKSTIINDKHSNLHIFIRLFPKCTGPQILIPACDTPLLAWIVIHPLLITKQCLIFHSPQQEHDITLWRTPSTGSAHNSAIKLKQTTCFIT
jgi:hypothetical protein